MIDFSQEEKMIVLLYSPGTRLGLIAELTAMKTQLTPVEKKLRSLADSVLYKLERMTDTEFEHHDFFPGANE